jgi:hypothetical protein
MVDTANLHLRSLIAAGAQVMRAVVQADPVCQEVDVVRSLQAITDLHLIC